MNAISPKIEPRHFGLRALVYVRQSTPRQVLASQESTRRQYQLAERAQQMGWPAPRIEVIDEDLGLSGAGSQQRLGFQRLVAAIGLGEVGLVLVTEVSRLSRLNSDWHRVIELCAVFRTLIADEDGVYDAQDANDRLLLGMKGTLFAAELHILQARMRGWVLSRGANPQPSQGIAPRRRLWPGPTATSTSTSAAPSSAWSRPAPRSARSRPGSAATRPPSIASWAGTASATAAAGSAATSR